MIARNYKVLSALLIALIVGALALTGCGGTESAADTSSGNTDSSGTTNDAAGSTQLADDPALAAETLVIEDIVVGTGAEAQAGNVAQVHYTGWLTDGKKFDSSVDRGKPFEFVLGAGKVIAGWDQGVLGMKVGGKRKLTIPPSMGYGDTAVGAIPAGSTLVFEVELLAVK